MYKYVNVRVQLKYRYLPDEYFYVGSWNFENLDYLI